MATIALKDLSELPAAAKKVLKLAGNKKIFCFYGDLGAGKTTLIKEMCRQLGIKDSGSSPTFSLVNEYRTPIPRLPGSPVPPSPETEKRRAGEAEKTAEELVVYHFDLYRLKNENEIYDIGYEDYVFGNNYCFIEWPEKIEKLLPANIVKVRIKVNGSERQIELE